MMQEIFNTAECRYSPKCRGMNNQVVSTAVNFILNRNDATVKNTDLVFDKLIILTNRAFVTPLQT